MKIYFKLIVYFILPILFYSCSSIGNINVKYDKPYKSLFSNKNYTITSTLNKNSYFIKNQRPQEFIKNIFGPRIGSTFKFNGKKSNYLIIQVDDRSFLSSSNDNLDEYKIIIELEKLSQNYNYELNDSNVELLREVGMGYIIQLFEINGKLKMHNINSNSLKADVKLSFDRIREYGADSSAVNSGEISGSFELPIKE